MFLCKRWVYNDGMHTQQAIWQVKHSHIVRSLSLCTVYTILQRVYELSLQYSLSCLLHSQCRKTSLLCSAKNPKGFWTRRLSLFVSHNWEERKNVQADTPLKLDFPEVGRGGSGHRTTARCQKNSVQLNTLLETRATSSRQKPTRQLARTRAHPLFFFWYGEQQAWQSRNWGVGYRCWG